jgi:PKHD-type hydroxylase
MLLQIPDVLTADQVMQCRRALDQADWVDGKVTAGYQSGRVKNNMQRRKITRQPERRAT